MTATQKMWIGRLQKLMHAVHLKNASVLLLPFKAIYRFYFVMPFEENGAGYGPAIFAVNMLISISLSIVLFVAGVGVYARMEVSPERLISAAQESACVADRLKEKMKFATEPIKYMELNSTITACEKFGEGGTLDQQRKAMQGL